jgi:hypothetical protein
VSWILHRYQDQAAFKVASDIGANVPVALDGTVAEQVVAIGSNNVRPFGMIDASQLQGQRATVYEEDNYVKAVVGASVAANNEVSVATWGRIGPAVGASAVGVWALGQTMEAGNPGDIVTIKVKPRQVSGLV